MRTQLLSHNKIAYQKVCKAFETSDRTCVVHPTGTGKSYLIAAVSENYKKVLVLGPNTFVLNQVHDVLAWRKKGIEYMTYSMLTTLDVKPTGYDLICLDEFHRAGAQTWGAHVRELLDENPQAKVFGTTATPVRYLDNERDMSEEIFGHNVASHISIGEAWSRAILPVPSFVVGLFNFHKTLADAEERIRNSRKLTDEEKRKRIFKLSNARLEWENSMGMPSILQRHLDPGIRRVIIFCADINRLESIRETVVGWFRFAGFKVASSCTVHIGQTDKQIREAMAEFESDEGDGVRLMFSVNMLNEGVHIPRVGAVLMLRTTESRIIYMQQMGRCLTAANTEKPVVLDMVDNITTTSAVHILQDDFLGWQEFMKEQDDGYEEKRFNVTDYRKTIRDVLELLSPLELSQETWHDKYEQVLAYCEEYGRVPKPNECDIYRKYKYLIVHHRDEEEVRSLIKKYGKLIWNEENREYMMEELRRFHQVEKRKPNVHIPAECRLYGMMGNIRRNDPENPILAELGMQAVKKGENFFEDALSVVSQFCKEKGRLPLRSREDENALVGKWQYLCKKYSDRKEVVELRSRYIKEKIDINMMLAEIESYAMRTGYLPSNPESAGKILAQWYKHVFGKYKDHPKVLELSHRYLRYREEMAIRTVEDFLREHGRLPYSRVLGEEEFKAMRALDNLAKKHADNQRVQALLKQRKQYRKPKTK